MTEPEKKPESPARLTLVLLSITLATSLLLGLTDYITRDRIREIYIEKTASAMREVLPADEYTESDYSGSDSLVKGVCLAYIGGDIGGYVVEVAPSGFGGAVNMVVGVDPDGVVTGVAVTGMTETSGLGSAAAGEGFRNQYVGGNGGFAVNKDGGDIDALTGATITSRAVTDGVNAAVKAVESLGWEASGK